MGESNDSANGILLDNNSEINEERCDTCISTTSNPIQSNNERQFTKLAKQ